MYFFVINLCFKGPYLYFLFLTLVLRVLILFRGRFIGVHYLGNPGCRFLRPHITGPYIARYRLRAHLFYLVCTTTPCSARPRSLCTGSIGAIPLPTELGSFFPPVVASGNYSRCGRRKYSLHSPNTVKYVGPKTIAAKQPL